MMFWLGCIFTKNEDINVIIFMQQESLKIVICLVSPVKN